MARPSCPSGFEKKEADLCHVKEALEQHEEEGGAGSNFSGTFHSAHIERVRHADALFERKTDFSHPHIGIGPNAVWRAWQKISVNS